MLLVLWMLRALLTVHVTSDALLHQDESLHICKLRLLLALQYFGAACFVFDSKMDSWNGMSTSLFVGFCISVSNMKARLPTGYYRTLYNGCC